MPPTTRSGVSQWTFEKSGPPKEIAPNCYRAVYYRDPPKKIFTPTDVTEDELEDLTQSKLLVGKPVSLEHFVPPQCNYIGTIVDQGARFGEDGKREYYADFRLTDKEPDYTTSMCDVVKNYINTGIIGVSISQDIENRLVRHIALTNNPRRKDCFIVDQSATAMEAAQKEAEEKAAAAIAAASAKPATCMYTPHGAQNLEPVVHSHSFVPSTRHASSRCCTRPRR
jgi:hypothetical protein